MKKPPIYWSEAKIYLSKQDRVIKHLINKYKDGNYLPPFPKETDVFLSLNIGIAGFSSRI